jgi:hypothetical protein
MGVWLNRKPTYAFSKWLPWVLLVGGFILDKFSVHWIVALHQLTGWEVFLGTINNNYLLVRLGHVLIALAVVIWITRWWKNMPPLVTKIGSETLTIYAVHYVLLYGTWLGIGLATFWKKSLAPVPVAIGAALFVVGFIVLIAHIATVREVIYQRVPAKAKYTFRVGRVVVLRFYRREMRPLMQRLRFVRASS